MTLYASLEKKRTFCPEPGVFASRRIERTDPYCLLRSSGVMGCWARRVGVGDVARASSADCLLSASIEPEPVYREHAEDMRKRKDIRLMAACICIADGLLSFVPKMDLTELNGCVPNSPAVGDVNDMFDAVVHSQRCQSKVTLTMKTNEEDDG